ncbi:phage holin family protein [Demequina lutea]|uniref:Protein-S-isoprenylcysteine O-methyltransferase Ste14 n=1 Tax=Demequina lutea TaxID=431489 RepID=A0A7Z0CGA5_9MICO|nr:phage holin family protein [Demequina lutea]NYI40186.1 protein-S-isoprenylcysteine O-methyltransferase Ste14 [Demequina lutea]
MAAGFGKYVVNALVAATAGRVTGILRGELEDAKVEMQTKAKGLGIGAALVAVATTFLFFAIAVFLTAAVLGLAQVWPAWLAALVVGGTLLVIAGIFIAIGAAKINKNKDLRPERAIAHLTKFFAR